MLIKERVRRLLLAKTGGGNANAKNNNLRVVKQQQSSTMRRFRKTEFDTLTTVSESLSDEDDSDDESSTALGRGSTVTTNSTVSEEQLLMDQNLTLQEDPYADVRERLEALSAADRSKYAFHETPSSPNNAPQPPPHAQHEVVWWIAFSCYLACAVLLIIGHIRDFCGWLFPGTSRYLDSYNQRYAPLLGNWEKLYTRRIFHRIQDCFSRPLCSAPKVEFWVLERCSTDGQKTMQLLGDHRDQPLHVQQEYKTLEAQNMLKPVTDNTSTIPLTARKCLNLGSYNYLGFADDWTDTCGPSVHAAFQRFGVATSSSLQDYGKTTLHDQVEKTVAEYVGKEDALLLSMGFNTNATILPALVQQGDLIISDALNHTSIVNGARASGAAIRIFQHNDMKDLESIVKQAIIFGKPRTRRPWNKILVVVEGVYSMEGEYCDLRGVVRICKKYGCYLYLDEAHSIGAMGMTGRGCCEYCGVDPSRDVDILMGTFTKSFAGMGGYIAASKRVIEYLRKACAASVHHTSMSPVVCQQVLTAFRVIMGKDGTNIGKKKLQALRDNSNYFRMRCEEIGLQVLGQYDSPVIPVMLYHMTKVGAFSRECYKRGLAVVVVGAPAVPVLECRVRFCMSAGHTRSQLDFALKEIEEIAEIVQIRHGSIKRQ